MKSLRNLAQMHRGGIVSCSDSAVTPWTSTQRRFQVLGLDTLKGLRRMLLKSWTLGRKKLRLQEKQAMANTPLQLSSLGAKRRRHFVFLPPCCLKGLSTSGQHYLAAARG